MRKVFGRKRAEAERAALAEEIHARNLLADAIARIELRLSATLARSEQSQANTEASLDDLHDLVASQTTDLARVVEHLASMCAALAERVEAEQLERRVLVEAVTELARQSTPSIAAPPVEHQHRVIGGTVTAEEPPELEISLVEPQPEVFENAPRSLVSTQVWSASRKAWSPDPE